MTMRASKNYRYADSHKGKDYGENYDLSLYLKDTRDSRVWNVEQELLLEIIGNKTIGKYLDFACGTGRIIQFMEPYVQSSVGIDVSEEMIKVARTKTTRSDIACLDILNDELDTGVLSDTNLITAFRFFLNAEESLRINVLRQLVTFLSEDGCLVFNIHGNKHSITHGYVLAYNWMKSIKLRLQGKDPSGYFFRTQLSVGQVKELVDKANLQVERIYSYGFLPSIISKLLPPKLWHNIERNLVTTRILWGTHLMFVCKRRPAKI